MHANGRPRDTRISAPLGRLEFPGWRERCRTLDRMRAQVTGGLYRRWQDLDLANVGYPIAELNADGSCVITKPDRTGGIVNRATVIEQLVYEIGDPAHYLTPDVDLDFTTVEAEASGPNRVSVRGATGRPPTDTYKVSLAYEAGFSASGQLLVHGSDCIEKARACGEMILRRVERRL